MDIIRNYLESMFGGLPNTEEVQRAKQELLKKMEIKYKELIYDGKSENEAIGMVISKYGNLADLADDLGLEKSEMDGTAFGKSVSYEEAFEYISDVSVSRFLLALGIMLCITSPIGLVMAGGMEALSISGLMTRMTFGAGFIILLVTVAVGVGLIILSTSKTKKWNYLKKESCSIDMFTAKTIAEEQVANQFNKNVMLAVGIGLCIISVAPAIVIDTISSNDFLNDGVAPTLLFIMVAIGVFLIIASGAKDNAYNTLLSLNGGYDFKNNTSKGKSKEVKFSVEIGNDKKKKKRKRYSTGDPFMDAVFANYWQIVTVIFFIGGFVFGEWGDIWIIWLVAPIFHSFLKKMY